MRLFLLPAYIRQNIVFLVISLFSAWYFIWRLWALYQPCNNFFPFPTFYLIHVLIEVICFGQWKFCGYSYINREDVLQPKYNFLLYNYRQSRNHFTCSTIYSSNKFQRICTQEFDLITIIVFRIKSNVCFLFVCLCHVNIDLTNFLQSYTHIRKPTHNIIVLNGCGFNHNLTHSNKDYGFHQTYVLNTYAVCSPEQQNEYIRRELNLSNLITFICFNWILLFNSKTYKRTTFWASVSDSRWKLICCLVSFRFANATQTIEPISKFRMCWWSTHTFWSTWYGWTAITLIHFNIGKNKLQFATCRLKWSDCEIKSKMLIAFNSNKTEPMR